MKPLLVTSGEPAGVGPDLCLALAEHDFPVVVMCDPAVLEARAKQLNIKVNIVEYNKNTTRLGLRNHLAVLPLACAAPVVAGKLNVLNANYVLDMLGQAANYCLNGDFVGLITAPVHKAIINQAGFDFTGHTEFFAHACGVDSVVMLLVCKAMRVALVTTHLPLHQVSASITSAKIIEVITILHSTLQRHFNISVPKIYVSGLNPHAGEGGYLGREELDVIMPALNVLKNNGINVSGPFSADTMFLKHEECDVFVVMYHDQGLPVLKYAGFGQAVNVTLGLPFIRTSVDHGTALELAGSGKADTGSLISAAKLANSKRLP
jgi:4-hydroxythreonine-4-phosphate dehydrogenase